MGINQIISQSLNLYKSAENSILTCDGDEKVDYICEGDVTICALSRKELDKFLYLSDSVLIRFFEFNIFDGISLSDNKSVSDPVLDNICYYLLSVYESDGAVAFKKIRGFQVIQSEGEYEDLV